MRNSEKTLFNSIRNNQDIASKDILSLVEEKGDVFTDFLFEVISKGLDEYTGSESLDYLNKVFEYLSIIIANNQEINRARINKRTSKLLEKIDRVMIERKKYFRNKTLAYKDLGKVKNQLVELEVFNDKKETKQYDLMEYLTTEIKDLAYVEYTLKKVPSLVNVTDMYGRTLYENLIHRYILNVDENNEEEVMYLRSILMFIGQQKNFSLSQGDKKKCLEETYKYIEWLGCRKKEAKKNKQKIEWLNDLKNMIVENGEHKNDMIATAAKFNIPVDFDEEIMEAVEKLEPVTPEKYPEREIVDDYIITIDGDNAVEIDDALSCKKLENGNYLLGVHIASILGYFPYNSPVVEEAINRVHSIYLPQKYQEKENDFNRTIPIFPYKFSADKASLLADEPRLTRSYYFEIDDFGNVVNERFPKTIIKSSKRMTYGEVNNILKKGTPNDELQETINNLKTVTNLLERKYKPTELYASIKENTMDAADLRVKRVGAEKIVYQSML